MWHGMLLSFKLDRPSHLNKAQGGHERAKSADKGQVCGQWELKREQLRGHKFNTLESLMWQGMVVELVIQVVNGGAQFGPREGKVSYDSMEVARKRGN